jgi:hypothetical protein
MLADCKDLRLRLELFGRRLGRDPAWVRADARRRAAAPLLVEAMRLRPRLRIDARIGSNEDLVDGLQQRSST